MNQITKKLIREHYIHQLTQCGPKPANCIIDKAQIWWPASFYMVRGNTVFDWDRESPQRDFYDVGIAGRRHPAIVTAVIRVGLYWMVPCSHSRGRGAVKVALRPGDESFAICGFSCKTSWPMLCGDPNAIDRGGLRVRPTDFIKIRQKISEILARSQTLQE